mmetsp:Transcript_13094/g.21387  ORF Transcript_13094/g.21387 Transcript_13094/m.21387 type:complete len:86 (-) Transcript_13094:22-279(-)
MDDIVGRRSGCLYGILLRPLEATPLTMGIRATERAIIDGAFKVASRERDDDHKTVRKAAIPSSRRCGDRKPREVVPPIDNSRRIC